MRHSPACLDRGLGLATRWVRLANTLFAVSSSSTPRILDSWTPSPFDFGLFIFAAFVLRRNGFVRPLRFLVARDSSLVIRPPFRDSTELAEVNPQSEIRIPCSLFPSSTRAHRNHLFTCQRASRRVGITHHTVSTLYICRALYRILRNYRSPLFPGPTVISPCRLASYEKHHRTAGGSSSSRLSG